MEMEREEGAQNNSFETKKSLGSTIQPLQSSTLASGLLITSPELRVYHHSPFLCADESVINNAWLISDTSPFFNSFEKYSEWQKHGIIIRVK